MQEFVWTSDQIREALSKDYNKPLMRAVDPHSYLDRREIPKYGINEVALYLGIKPGTLRNWFFGYSRTIQGQSVLYDRLIEPAAHNPYGMTLSFYNLAEAQVLAATRQTWTIAPAIELPADGERPQFGQKPRKKTEIRISMQAIRNALNYVRNESPVHPLISQYFHTDGKSLFVRIVEGELKHHLTVNISRGGQLAFSAILDLYLDRIERDQTGPIKVYPMRHIEDADKSIVIIPSVASGRPTVSGTGIRVEAIWNRSQAGETTKELAEDYQIDQRVIEKAISYFTDVKAA